MEDVTESAEVSLGLVRPIIVADRRDDNGHQKLPPWASFLTLCGFFSRSLQLENARLVTVVLLPTRELAAAFSSLGTILGSLKSTVDFLTWEQFLALPEDTELYIKLVHKGVRRSLKGVAKEKKESSHGLYRRLKITNGPKAIRGSSDLVVKSSFGRQSLSMTEHPKERDFKSIIRAGTFLKAISKYYKPNWLVSNQTEGLVVSTKTEWNRVCKSIRLGVSGHSTLTDLADILLASDKPDSSLSRIAVCAPGKKVDSVYAPMAILDGPRAVFQWREVSARNLLILVGRSEFDEEASGTIFDLTSSRDDALLPKEYTTLASVVPTGMGLAAFAVPYQ